MWQLGARGRVSRMVGPVAAGLVVLAGAAAGPARAELRTGAGGDPVDAGLPGGLDLVGLTAAYDDAAGTIAATITLREAPSDDHDGFVQVWLRKPAADGTCTTSRPGASMGDYTAPSVSAGLWFQTEGDAPAASLRKTQLPDGFTVTVTDPSLVRRPYTCAWAQVSPDNDPETILDAFDTAVALRLPDVKAPVGSGSAVTPTGEIPGVPPTPGSTALGTLPQGPTTPPPAQPRPAALRLSIVSAPAARRGRWLTARVRLSNGGGATARHVRLSVRPPHGVRLAHRVFTMASLAPGRRRTLLIGLRLDRGAPRAPRLALAATATGLRRVTGTLRVAPRS
jgi:hypothetical protein